MLDLDQHPETRVIRFVLYDPTLLDECSLQPEDFEYFTFQWAELLKRKKEGKEIHLEKTYYDPKFQLSQFLDNGELILRREFPKYAAEVREMAILRNLKNTESLDEV